jgi:hypothetical protein
MVQSPISAWGRRERRRTCYVRTLVHSYTRTLVHSLASGIAVGVLCLSGGTVWTQTADHGAESGGCNRSAALVASSQLVAFPFTSSDPARDAAWNEPCSKKPSVTISGEGPIAVNADLALTAEVKPDEAQGGTYTWSQASGPPNGTATFDPADPTTASTVNFSATVPGVYTVNVSYYAPGWENCSAVSKEITVIKVEIAGFHRVVYRPGNERTVRVTLTPSPLPSGVTVDLDWELKSGSVGVVINPASITETKDVTIQGNVQSSSPNNVAFVANINGTLCTEQLFSVCAHPCKYKLESAEDVYNGNMYGANVHHTWESDSGAGHLGDLDKVTIQEQFRNTQSADPPFNGIWAAGPARAGTLGEVVDWMHLGAYRITGPYQPGTNGADQYHIISCQRCGAVNVELPNSECHAEYEMYDAEPGEGTTWKIRFSKSPTTALGTSYSDDPGHPAP